MHASAANTPPATQFNLHAQRALVSASNLGALGKNLHCKNPLQMIMPLWAARRHVAVACGCTHPVQHSTNTAATGRHGK